MSQSLRERIVEAMESSQPFVNIYMLLDQVDALEKLNQWQDISTAPKDGFHIILGHKNQPSEVGYWLDDEDGWECSFEPTHWMPLPAPPNDDLPPGLSLGDRLP